MRNNNEFIKDLCNELAQPVTTLMLALELLERGPLEPQDLVVIKTEVQRLRTIVEDLRDNSTPGLTSLVA